MKPVSIRLSEDEHKVLSQAAVARATTLSALLRAAAIKLAQAAGAKPRTEGTTTITVELWPADVAALADYRNKTDIDTNGAAARAALRVGLIHRGCLLLEDNSFPDTLGVV